MIATEYLNTSGTVAGVTDEDDTPKSPDAITKNIALETRMVLILNWMKELGVESSLGIVEQAFPDLEMTVGVPE